MLYRAAHAPVGHPEVNYDWWQHVRDDVICQGGVCFVGNRRLRTAATRAISGYNPKDWLLSHVTIMASVDTEEGHDGATYPNYLITQPTSQFVNNNGDAWEKQLLLSTFRTFVGAENYVEHVQNPALSKGKIIDAVSREIPVYHPRTKEPIVYGDGKPVSSVYIDILVATSRKFEELCRSVTAGETDSMSMGCLLKFTICSECGKVMYRDADACHHIRFNKGGSHVDLEGRTRRTAELCGHASDKSSCEFVESSWVSVPAFRGAKRRNVLQVDRKKFASSMERAQKQAEERFSSIYTKARAASIGERLETANNRIILPRIVELAKYPEV